MTKFNKPIKTGTTSPIKTVNSSRDTKSELFLLAVSNFVGKNTFYESAKNRDDRFSALCRKVAVEDGRWFLGFVGWLRNDAFMRSASIVAAVEGAHGLLSLPARPDRSYELSATPRGLVAASMARADEPGELLAYWISKYGKNVPAAVKKGIADGAKRLYNEYSLLKYDTESKGFRFADVIQISHAKADSAIQNDLFHYALNRRYGRGNILWKVPYQIPLILPMVENRKYLDMIPVEDRRELLGTDRVKDMFKVAGMTWEALSGWLQGPMDAQAWEAVIPSMGYMALLRNLRNFQQAGISQKAFNDVLSRISNPEQVAKSKQFPFRFLAAYNDNKGNLKIMSALENALQASLSNVPELDGNTLILVDRSESMFQTDVNQELSRADQAAIFGIALAQRAHNATLVQYGGKWYGSTGPESKVVNFRKGDSILPLLNKFQNMGNTNTVGAIQSHLTSEHTRVILITDEQHNGLSRKDPGTVVPENIPMYTWNLEGYSTGGKSGNAKRHTWGGLTDKGFQMIPLIEAGQNQKWPWELDSKK